LKAGDRVKAMTALLRSGDSQKIVFFAGVSGAKNKEIYVMAANYLQTTQWHDNPDTIKSIVTFYTKVNIYLFYCNVYLFFFFRLRLWNRFCVSMKHGLKWRLMTSATMKR
jgi:hypothetical protein